MMGGLLGRDEYHDAASPVYLPISIVVAWFPVRVSHSGGGKGKGHGKDKKGDCSHGKPPVLPVTKIS